MKNDPIVLYIPKSLMITLDNELGFLERFTEEEYVKKGIDNYVFMTLNSKPRKLILAYIPEKK